MISAMKVCYLQFYNETRELETSENAYNIKHLDILTLPFCF